jgi:ABC-type dipeptide/oligopeptide/nickel transport system permease subunit
LAFYKLAGTQVRLGLLFALSLTAANQSPAQGFSISGTVRDPNRKPLPNVAVELSTRSQGRRITGTDENGRYIFSGLAPGEYQVSFELAGYATLIRVVPVKFDKDSKDDDKDGDTTLVPEKRRSKKR